MAEAEPQGMKKDREYWEARSHGELEAYTDGELGKALRTEFRMGRYAAAMRKAEKIRFILDSDIRPTIMAEAEVRMDEAASRRRERKQRVRSAASQFDRRSKLRSVEILSRPFMDSAAGIRARRGVRASRQSNGETFDLSHEVAMILERRGVLSGYAYLRHRFERGSMGASGRVGSFTVAPEVDAPTEEIVAEILEQLFTSE